MQVNQVKVFYTNIFRVHMKNSSQTNFWCKTYKGIACFEQNLTWQYNSKKCTIKYIIQWLHKSIAIKITVLEKETIGL